jgi:hypothetical protein
LSTKTRTYKDYKDFFEEVNKSNRLEFYEYSFTLLFSFLEDRVNKIYSEEYQVSNGVSPRPYDLKQSLYVKLVDVKKLGMTYPPSVIKQLDIIVNRRNEIIHEALFNINTITKQEINVLTKFCRHIDKIRTNQKKRLGQHKRNTLKLRFPKSLPDLSKYRRVENPSPYPLSHKY